MPVYDYKPNDNIFDIESLQNLYVDTHYFPARHAVEIFYLSDVPGLHDFNAEQKDGQTAKDVITAQIMKRNYSLRHLLHAKQKPLQLRFFNLRTPRNLARYCFFWGLTPTKSSAHNYMDAHGNVSVVTDQSLHRAKLRHYRRVYPNWIPLNAYKRALRSGQDFTDPRSMNMDLAYYTVKRTDPLYKMSPDRYGITMGFNSDNYDLTMIATFLGHVVHNPYGWRYLNRFFQADAHDDTGHWKDRWVIPQTVTVPQNGKPKHIRLIGKRKQAVEAERDALLRILTPEFFRHYNDLLFTRYKKRMPNLLQSQPDLQSPDKRGSKNQFVQKDNPAYYIYKGWMVSNRYLDVAKLNEHMKFVPLKRIAAMSGWQILESKNVTANTKFLHNLAQVADLIAYNNSDVQVTKQVFELPTYQDALVLRRNLLRKYPQLTYTYDRKSALKRYLARKNSEQAIQPGDSDKTKIEKLNHKNGSSDIERAVQTGKGLFRYSKQARASADPQDAVVEPDHLRYSPLKDDSSSAKFISNVIAPYHPMADWPDIEYLFPDPRALKIFKHAHPDQHLEHDRPFNLLEDTMDWCKRVDRKYGLTGLPPADEAHVLDDGHSLAKTFQPIYDLYKKVEGHNVNATLDADTGKRKLTNIKGEAETVGPSIDMTGLLHATNANIPYLHRNGNSTGTLATFSYGGIHGVEFKLGKFKADYRHYLKMRGAFRAVKERSIPHEHQQSLFPTESVGRTKPKNPDPRIARRMKTITYGGEQVPTKQFVKGSGKHTQWKAPEAPHLYKHPKGSSYSLSDRYSYVSVDPVSHEDFSGYYPMLISRLGIMWPHDEPRDEYHHIYVERLHLKAELKKHVKNSPKWNDINQKQLLRKLLLNSASGAGDAKFFSTIRMNNKIVSMRIMGQLFTWRMAQSVCLADVHDHAKVTSSNTDGVYLAGLPDKVNDVALQKAVRPMSLFIGPVPLSRFVSKDANNRAEITNYGTQDKPKNVLTEAKGATLNAWQGPSVTATVSHPAIIDYTLAHYLAYQPDPCNRDLNMNAVMNLIDKKRQELYSDDAKTRADGLIFFQWIIASNPGKHRYPFLLPLRKTADGWHQQGRAIAIPHTNRLFLTKHAGTDTVLAMATRQKVNERTFRKRQANGQTVANDPNVVRIYASWGDDCLPDGLGNGYAAHRYVGRVAKMPGMPEHQNVHIEDRSLYELTKEQVRAIADSLDYGAYRQMTARKFHASWDNNQ